MPVKITPIESTEQWLELRHKCVGGSEIAALDGVHPYKTRLALHVEKSSPTPPIDEDSPAKRRGRKLEAYAVELLREEFPTWDIVQPRTHYLDESIKGGCTPDTLVMAPEPHGRGTVQIKSQEESLFKKLWFDEQGNLRAPLYVAKQVRWEASLTGSSWCAAAALTIGWQGVNLYVVDVPFDAQDTQHDRDQCAIFWDGVERGIRPEPDYGRDGSLLAKLYAKDDGTEIDLSGDNELPEILDRYDRALEARKFNESEVETCKAVITHKLGTAARGIFAGGIIKATTINVKAADKPRDAYSYRKITVARTKDKAA